MPICILRITLTPDIIHPPPPPPPHTHTSTHAICIWKSQFTRDWFLVRFRLLAEDILVEQERMVRRYKIWEQYRQLNATEVPLVSQLQTLLERGVQVTHHQLSGNIVDNAILRYDSAGNTLELWFQQAGYFSKKDVVLVRMRV